MAIKIWGEKSATPRQFAQFVWDIDLNIITEYWMERHEEEYENMTDREKELVQEQMNKYHDRIIKLVGCKV